MQKQTTFIVVLFTLFVLFGVANANDHHSKHHKHEQQEERDDEVYFLNTTNADRPQDCDCVSGGISRFVYEDSNIKGCIGGCGGGDFVFHQQGYLIRTINVWIGCGTENNGMRGIQVVLTNGQSITRGSACGDYKSFTFNRGELLTGTLVLGGNGIGTRVGYVGFTTNQQRSFSAGTLHTPYNFQADGRALSGIFGGSGRDIDRLGFLVTKKVSYSILQDVKYPTLASITSGLAPRILAQDNTCNNGNSAIPKTLKYTETTGEDRCWSAQTSLSLEVSLSVTAGAPVVAQVSSGYKWTVGATTSYSRCTRSSTTVESSITISTPPRTSCKTQSIQFNSAVVSIPWTGTTKLVFTDGSSYNTASSGTYSGTFVTKSSLKRNCTPVSVCSSNDGADADNVVDDDSMDAVITDDDDNDDDVSTTTVGAVAADDDEEDDSVSFELPQNEPLNDLLQNTPVGDVVIA